MFDIFKKKDLPKAQKRKKKSPTKKVYHKQYTKYTDKRRNLILAELAGGMSRRAACHYAGISRKTFYNWLEKHEDFAADVKAAEASAEKIMIEKTRKERGGSRWLLARRFRTDWGDKLEVEVKGPTKIKIEWPEEQSE